MPHLDPTDKMPTFFTSHRLNVAGSIGPPSRLLVPPSCPFGVEDKPLHEAPPRARRSQAAVALLACIVATPHSNGKITPHFQSASILRPARQRVKPVPSFASFQHSCYQRPNWPTTHGHPVSPRHSTTLDLVRDRWKRGRSSYQR